MDVVDITGVAFSPDNLARARVNQLGGDAELPAADLDTAAQAVANAQQSADFAQIDIRFPETE